MRPVLCVMLAGPGIVAGARTAQACDCKPAPPPDQALARADIVFEGRAGKGEFVEERQRVPFEVHKVYKGDPGPTAEVWTNDSDDSCGRFYKAGEPYLVYTWVSKDKIWDSLCSRTRLLDNAKKDLTELGPGEEPHPHPVRETMSPPAVETPSDDVAPSPEPVAPTPTAQQPPTEPTPTAPHPNGGCAASVADRAPTGTAWGWACLALVALGRRRR